MPTTEYNVSLIRRACENYSQQQILEALDELQKIVYSQDVEQTLKVDAATGLPPLLTTVAGQFQYDCPADCRRTAAIFKKTARFVGESGYHGPERVYYFNGSGYYSELVSSRDRQPDGTLATVTFVDDPGDTTDTFYHAYWVTPPDISTIEDQLVLPDHLHYLVRKGVIAMLTDEEYGETGYGEGTIERLATKIRKQLSRGAQARMGYTPVQEQDQVYPDGYYDQRF